MQLGLPPSDLRRLKDIVESLLYARNRILIRIYGKPRARRFVRFRSMRAAERSFGFRVAVDAQVVEPRNVIGMGVRQKHGVERIDMMRERLHAELRPRIDDDVRFAPVGVSMRYVRTAPKALVFRIERSTHAAMTGNRRYAVTRTGAG